MKKSILLITLIMVVLAVSVLTGCIRKELSDSDLANTKEYDFTGFTGLEVRDAFQIEVTPSDTYRVTVAASQAVLDRVKVTMSGSRLVLEFNHWWFFSWHGTPKVTVTMPELKFLELSGASHGKVRGFKSSQELELSLSGASELDIDMEGGKFNSEISGASKLSGYLKATSSRIKLSGASEVKLSGSGGDLVLSGSGASHAALSNYLVNNADIEFSGASDSSLNVNGKMDVDLSGASSLEYTGNPTLGNTDISGASSMKQKP